MNLADLKGTPISEVNEDSPAHVKRMFRRMDAPGGFGCSKCNRTFKTKAGLKQHKKDRHPTAKQRAYAEKRAARKAAALAEVEDPPDPHDGPDLFTDYQRPCVVCNAVPTVGTIELCGPCCFGEADTVDGNW